MSKFHLSALGLLPVLLATATIAAPSTAHADLITLTDQASSVTVQTGVLSGTGLAAGGLQTWTLDAVNQLSYMGLWYRVGDSATTPESPLAALPHTYTVMDNNLDPGNDYLRIVYTGAGFTVTQEIYLQGTPFGSGLATMNQDINVANTSASTISFHLFQFTNFDLSGTAGGDVASIPNVINTAQQTDGLMLAQESLTSRDVVPSYCEVGLMTDTNALLTRLTNSVADNLNDNDITAVGDAYWAFQWDTVLAPGGEFPISKTLSVQVVPEPMTLAMLLIGGAGLAGARLRRRSRAC